MKYNKSSGKHSPYIIVENRLAIYTDGSCDNSGDKIGGYGAVVTLGGRKVLTLSGGELDTTSSRMEIRAVIESIREVEAVYPAETELHIYTDSTYVKNSITKWIGGWIRRGWVRADGKPVKNRDLWEELYPLCYAEGRHHEEIEWSHVRGHSDDLFNEEADVLANLGRKTQVRHASIEVHPEDLRQKGD